MDILKHIFQGNDSAIKDYYFTSQPSETEFLLAFHLYRVSKNEYSLKTLGIVSEEYAKINNDEKFKEDFAYLIQSHVGLDYAFFNHMKDSNIFKDFLKEYGSVFQERSELMLDKINSENPTESNKKALTDLQKINEIILEANPIKTKKDIPFQEPPSPLNWRISELKNPLSKEHEDVAERYLLLSAYTEFKEKNLPIDEIDQIVDKTKEIREQFIKNSSNSDGAFSPFLFCLHHDIVSVIAKKDNLGKQFNSTNLWEDIPKYTFENISKANFNSINIPNEVKEACAEDKVKIAIWVLKKDGQAVFGHEHQSFIKSRPVHHIDLANGEDVVSAGAILFSEDMSKVIAINPASGHYRPDVESCLHLKKALDKTNLDTRDTIICEFNWKPTKLNVKESFSLPCADNISKSISTIRENSLAPSEPNASKKLAIHS